MLANIFWSVLEAGNRGYCRVFARAMNARRWAWRQQIRSARIVLESRMQKHWHVQFRMLDELCNKALPTLLMLEGLIGETRIAYQLTFATSLRTAFQAEDIPDTLHQIYWVKWQELYKVHEALVIQLYRIHHVLASLGNIGREDLRHDRVHDALETVLNSCKLTVTRCRTDIGALTNNPAMVQPL